MFRPLTVTWGTVAPRGKTQPTLGGHSQRCSEEEDQEGRREGWAPKGLAAAGAAGMLPRCHCWPLPLASTRDCAAAIPPGRRVFTERKGFCHLLRTRMAAITLLLPNTLRRSHVLLPRRKPRQTGQSHTRCLWKQIPLGEQGGWRKCPHEKGDDPPHVLHSTYRRALRREAWLGGQWVSLSAPSMKEGSKAQVPPRSPLGWSSTPSAVWFPSCQRWRAQSLLRGCFQFLTPHWDLSGGVSLEQSATLCSGCVHCSLQQPELLSHLASSSLNLAVIPVP